MEECKALCTGAKLCIIDFGLMASIEQDDMDTMVGRRRLTP